ncbi:MAG: GDP-mannose 4,6-dehydratase, partial [Elusimicrobiota bacterium]
LDSIRTLIDVRDAMESYWAATMKGESGEAYNIGGSKTISVGDFLKLLLRKSTANVRTRQDPALLRPADVTLQIPSVKKFEKATGWKPRRSFEDSVDMLLAHWRERTRRETAA